ncbi:MAG TPA: hypothetical protein VNR41_11145 [Xanthobacteraceae bacterium]|nr:hypothetical protein [Xanthobacteraceae bacterium]
MARPSPALILTIFIIAAALISPAPLSAASDGWQAYANPRFGTHADYPAAIFTRREPPPENGDGQTFTDKDGTAKLSIYGAFNSLENTPRTYVDELIRPRDAIRYERITKNFFAVSGKRGETIWYQRCNFEGGASGTVHCFMLEYPAKEKQRWDPIVSRIAKSLRGGKIQ